MPHPGGRPRKPVYIASDAMPDKPYYTVPEAAELTHTHVKTIQARLRDGTLKGKKLGGVWRIYPESLTYDKVDANLNIEKR